LQKTKEKNAERIGERVLEVQEKEEEEEEMLKLFIGRTL